MKMLTAKQYGKRITRFGCISFVCLNLFWSSSITQAQVTSETPYDASEMSKRDRRFEAIPPVGGETFRVPGSRPSGPPVPPTRPAPPTRPTPSVSIAPPSAPVSAPTPASPSIIRGSGSNIGSVTLLFNPLSTRVRQGTLFTQDIIVNNPRGTGYDYAEVMIKYDPEYLMVKNVESTIVPAKYPAAKVMVNEVNNKKGIIRFGIENKTANFFYSGAIATINWYAKKKVFGARVSYIFVNESSKGSTSITAQNRDILGASSDPTDGVVAATLSIE
jgi:hypothetical protein